MKANQHSAEGGIVMNGYHVTLYTFLRYRFFLIWVVVSLGFLSHLQTAFAQEVAWFQSIDYEAWSVAVDRNGIYVTGRKCYEGPICDGVVEMRNLNGIKRWRRQFKMGQNTEPFAIAVHRSGIYVAGRTDVGSTSFIRKFGFKGKEIWTFRNTDPMREAWGVAVDDSGVYFSGSTSGISERVVIGRLDFAGNLVWLHELLESNEAGMPPIAIHDGTILTTSPDSGGDYGAMKLWVLDKHGNLQTQFDLPDFLGNKINQFAADDTGIYLSSFMGLVAKYDYAGVEIWRHQVPYESLSQGSVIAVDSGTVYFGDSSKYRNIEIRGLDAAQGNEIWRREWLNGNPFTLAIRDGRAYAAGFSDSRYSESGGFVLSINKFLHYRNLNRLVTFRILQDSIHRVSNGRGCKDSQKTKLTFHARLVSRTAKPLRGLQFSVRKLVEPCNTLIVNNEWASQNSRFFVPRVGDYADGVLGPGESVDIPFTVCQCGAYRLNIKLDVFGIAGQAQGH
jgi:outer membrane protein assembly factor BamB